MPVLTPYMISCAWIFSSSMPRQALIRSSACGCSSTVSPSRAIRTSFSRVSPEPSSTIVIRDSSRLAGRTRRHLLRF